MEYNLKSNQLKTAILLLVFNRPDTTYEVFKTIRQARPARLYIASDGPRSEIEGDLEKVVKVQRIATEVDWPCELKTLFRDKNLGCKKAVSESINWFFSQEKQGIILEDDCVANPDFFPFCENLLNRYVDDKRITSITGNNFQNNHWRGDSSYYFSKYNHCWGWATWRRAWQFYNGDLDFWPKWSKSEDWLKKIPDKVERNYWEDVFNKVYEKKINSWAYPWTGSIWYHGGLTITPNVNLVTNIGFGNNALHTILKNDRFSNLPTNNLEIIKHPKKIERNIDADNLVFNHHYEGKNLRFPRNLIMFILRVVKFIFFKKKIFNKING